jgi:hypothetical protein
MLQHLSREQHQMLEDLTGLQHTRTGQVRARQNRSQRETHRLGLVSEKDRQWDKWYQEFRKGKPYPKTWEFPWIPKLTGTSQ